MKLEPLVWIIIAILAYFATCKFFEIYDEIEFEYDPATGKQKATARKSHQLEGPKPLTIEGE